MGQAKESYGNKKQTPPLHCCFLVASCNSLLISVGVYDARSQFVLQLKFKYYSFLLPCVSQLIQLLPILYKINCLFSLPIDLFRQMCSWNELWVYFNRTAENTAPLPAFHPAMPICTTHPVYIHFNVPGTKKFSRTFCLASGSCGNAFVQRETF